VLRTRRPLLALVLLGVLLAGGYLVSAVRSDPDGDRGSGSASSAVSAGGPAASPAETSPGGLDTVAASTLPAEARQTLRLIDRGGPFPYERDGSVFGNVERILPRQPRGWYREYTVPTPGESDRGARRIVAGRDGVRYYTADHYGSFAIVDGGR
jgi:ribonuclease T1